VSFDLIMNIVCVTVLPPFASYAWCRALKRLRGWFWQGWIWSASLGGVTWAIQGQWPWAVLDAANAGVAIVLWWLSRRRRKRAPRAYGEKSAALVAALVAKVREAARPRPVPRLGPAGARL
jgi:hypothetical protein